MVRQRNLARLAGSCRRRSGPAPWPSGAASAPAARPSARRRRAAGPAPNRSASSPATRVATAAAGCPGSAAASIVLPVPGGPTIRRLCAAGRGDRDRALHRLLPAHVGEVERRRRACDAWYASPSSSYGSSGSCSFRNDTACDERGDGIDLDALDDRRLAGVLLRQDHAARTSSASASSASDSAALDLAHAPVERQLAGDQELLVPVVLDEVRRRAARRSPSAGPAPAPSFFTSAGARLISSCVRRERVAAVDDRAAERARPIPSPPSAASPTMVVLLQPAVATSTSTSHSSGSMPTRMKE